MKQDPARFLTDTLEQCRAAGIWLQTIFCQAVSLPLGWGAHMLGCSTIKQCFLCRALQMLQDYSLSVLQHFIKIFKQSIARHLLFNNITSCNVLCDSWICCFPCKSQKPNYKGTALGWQGMFFIAVSQNSTQTSKSSSRLKANLSLSPGKSHTDAEKNRDTHRSSALSNIYCFSCSEAQLQIPDASPIFKWSFYNYIAMPYGNTIGFLIATFNDSESPALTTKLLRELHPPSTEELVRDWQSHHHHWQSNSFMTSLEK